MENKKILILGAGYTGLAAAIELNKSKVETHIVEKSDKAGGLSQTITLSDIKFELGPHIYFDKDTEVTAFWRDLVGDKFKSYERNNRIFYNGKFIKSPLSVWDTLFKLGPFSVISIIWSFIIAKISRKRPINSAEDWVKANFGNQLFERFFKVYNEKIWGIKSSKISPNWAGQRIKSSLTTMVVKSLKKEHEFIIKTFDFPDGGSESIYNAQLNILNKAENVHLKYNCVATKISPSGSGFIVDFSNGEKGIYFSNIISSIHLSDLSKTLVGFPEVALNTLNNAINKLMYRNLVLVNLVFNKNGVKNFKEHWIDIHDPSITALRVTNFGNYNFGLSNSEKSGVGLEYNCFETEAIWTMSDEKIIEIALADLNKMGLIQDKPIDFSVIKLAKAYPIYFNAFEKPTEAIFSELIKIKGLELAGRNSMYKWNNMHHSVKTGILAARNCLGSKNNLFEVKGMVSIGKDSD